MAESKRKEYLFIVNDTPDGNERPYNTLRMAMNLPKLEGIHVRMFLIGDGIQCAMAKQCTANGYYNIERMLKSILRRAEVAA